jgi:hypothetical protein
MRSSGAGACNLVYVLLFLALHFRAEAQRYLAERCSTIGPPVERAAADERMLVGVDLQKFLMRVLTPPCGGTLAMVLPDLQIVCCTPSPLTSRVMRGFALCGRSCRFRQCNEPRCAS